MVERADIWFPLFGSLSRFARLSLTNISLNARAETEPLEGKSPRYGYDLRMETRNAPQNGMLQPRPD